MSTVLAMGNTKAQIVHDSVAIYDGCGACGMWCLAQFGDAGL